jgi:AraC family transcriptional regulator of adaptative response/methylated-DNA-[protein]-cysteine methyltransferase
MYDAGFGSSRGLYEQAAARLGMTPAMYARGGAGMSIGYTITTCTFGRMLVAATDRGVSKVAFADEDGILERDLVHEYPAAEIRRDDNGLASWIDAVLRVVGGAEAAERLPLDIRATAFRARVWAALRDIPRGSTRSYADVARDIGAPTSWRAVANACNANPVAVLIPCHRVVASGGKLGGYRSGVARKVKLLEGERDAG